MGCHLPSLVMEWAVVFVILGKSVLVIFLAKGPVETSVFLLIRGESEGVFGVLRVFRNDFSVCDKRGCSSVAVDHLCSELVGILRLFIFAFIHVLLIIKIEGKVPFEFEGGVIPHFRVRKVSVPSWFCGVVQHFADQVNV